MYRRADALATEADDPQPRELVYTPRRDSDATFRSVGVATVLFGVVIIAGAIVAANNQPTIGGAIMLVGTIVAAYVGFKKRGGERIVLAVEGGDLVVRTPSGAIRTRVALSLVESVIVDGGSLRRYQNVDLTEVSKNDIDRGCIVIVPEEPHRRVPLTPMDVPHEDCVEWAARIRTFLRGRGWTPLDERPPISSSL